jgi:hypothetical protein
MEDHRDQMPVGVLIEAGGHNVWKANTADELEHLRAIVDRMNAARASAGLPPVDEFDKARTVHGTLPSGKAATVRAMVERELAAGATIWAVDLNDDDSMAAAYAAGCPFVAKVDDRYALILQVDDEMMEVMGRTYAGKTLAWPMLDVVIAAAAGRDYANRNRPTATADAARAALTAARNALAAKLPFGEERSAIRGNLYSSRATDALTRLMSDPRLAASAAALQFAVNHAKGSRWSDAIDWCGRLHESLALDVPGDSQVTAVLDAAGPGAGMRLVWIDSDHELHVGDANTLGHHLDMQNLTGGPDVAAVYAVRDGELVRCTWATSATPYDEHDVAIATVVVTLPDGTQTTGTWKVDGRA